MSSVHYSRNIVGFLVLVFTCGNAEMYRNGHQPSGNMNADISFVQRKILEKFTDNPRFIYSTFMAKALKDVNSVTTQCLEDMDKIFEDIFAEVYPWQSGYLFYF